MVAASCVDVACLPATSTRTPRCRRTRMAAFDIFVPRYSPMPRARYKQNVASLIRCWCGRTCNARHALAAPSDGERCTGGYAPRGGTAPRCRRDALRNHCQYPTCSQTISVFSSVPCSVSAVRCGGVWTIHGCFTSRVLDRTVKAALFFGATTGISLMLCRAFRPLSAGDVFGLMTLVQNILCGDGGAGTGILRTPRLALPFPQHQPSSILPPRHCGHRDG